MIGYVEECPCRLTKYERETVFLKKVFCFGLTLD
jgi:hypothetical protein